MFLSRRDAFGFICNWPLLSMYVAMPKITWQLSHTPIEVEPVNGWRTFTVGMFTVRIGRYSWSFEPQDFRGEVLTTGPFANKPVNQQRAALARHLMDICTQLEVRKTSQS